MKWFNNMKIGSKLLLGFAVVTLITAIVGIFGLYNMDTINSMANKMYENELRGISFLKEANVNIIASNRAEKNAILAANASERHEYVQQIIDYDKKARKLFKKAEPLITSKEGKEIVSKFKDQWEKYKDVGERIINALKSENFQKETRAINLSQGLGRELSDKLDNMLTRLSKLKDDDAEKYQQMTTQIYKRSFMIMIFLVIGAVIISFFIGYYISSIIRKPLNRLTFILKDIAEGEGDLTKRVDIDSKDEIGDVATWFNAFADNIHELVVQ